LVVFGCIDNVAGAEPEVGVTCSHDGMPETDHERAPLPAFVTEALVLEGRGPRRGALQDAVVTETARRGPAATVKVTATVRGEAESDGAVIVSVAGCVPAARPNDDAEIVTLASPAPDDGAAVSHVLSDVTVHVAAGEPPVVIVIDCTGGVGADDVAENASVGGETDNGGLDVTSNVTATLRGESSAAGSVIVIVPASVPTGSPAALAATECARELPAVSEPEAGVIDSHVASSATV
jgi:hypothetical protein